MLDWNVLFCKKYLWGAFKEVFLWKGNSQKTAAWGEIHKCWSIGSERRNLLRTVYSSRWDGIKFMFYYVLLGLSYLMLELGIRELNLSQRSVVGYDCLNGNPQFWNQDMHPKKQESPSSFAPWIMSTWSNSEL